jgi:acyl dehydratase
MIVSEEQFDIDAVRTQWVGASIGRSASRYPVEHDPIRRYCHMTGELNPLYLDPDAAARGPYGRVMCPPGFVVYFLGSGPWPVPRGEPSVLPRDIPRLGNRAVNMGIEWSFTAPVLVGDRLVTDWTVEDVFVKPTRLDPVSVWMATVGTVANDRGVQVATYRNTVMYHRPPRRRADHA